MEVLAFVSWMLQFLPGVGLGGGWLRRDRKLVHMGKEMD